MAGPQPSTTDSTVTRRRVGEVLPHAELLSGRDVVATSCCSSAELVQPGDLYFALDSAAEDREAKAKQAIRRGAVAVVAEQPMRVTDAPQFRVENVRAALAQFCHDLVGSPTKQLSLAGVFGDFATASTTRLLASVFETAAGRPAWWDGRWMDEADGGAHDAGVRATAPLVASWLSRSVANGADHAVAGVTPGRENVDALAACEFQVICLTRQSAENDAGEPREAQRERLAGVVKRLRPGGVLVADATDPTCCRVLAECSRRVMTYGLDHPADVVGEVIERHANGQTLVVRHGGQSLAIETPVLGDRHAASCLAAIATGLAAGFDLQTIARGVQLAPRPVGVLEPVVLGQDFNVYVDAADRAETLREATQAVRPSTVGRLLTVVAGSQAGSAAGSAARLLSAAGAKSDLVIAAGEPEPGFTGRPEYRFVEDSFAAIALAIALAERGDA
ncbi:MAG: Mur ligase family protein, partial [Planctomycetota bacterium]